MTSIQTYKTAKYKPVQSKERMILISFRVKNLMWDLLTAQISCSTFCQENLTSRPRKGLKKYYFGVSFFSCKIHHRIFAKQLADQQKLER